MAFPSQCLSVRNAFIGYRDRLPDRLRFTFQDVYDLLVNQKDAAKKLKVGPDDDTGLVHFSILNQDVSTEVRKNLIHKWTSIETVDRMVGCMMGMAIGDSIGAPLEFIPVSDVVDQNHHYDPETNTYVGEKNRFRLKRGQWTDDCSMGLCMADSLIAKGEYDGVDIRLRFWNWWNRGYNNSFRLDATRHSRHSVGLGGNISMSLEDMETGESIAPVYDADTQDAGNGSIMRLCPIPLMFFRQMDKALEYSEQSSKTTHPGKLASACCRLLSFIIIEALSHQHGRDIKFFLEKTLDKYAKTYTTEEAAIYKLINSAEHENSRELCWNWKSKSLQIQKTMANRGKSYNGYPVSAGYFGSFCFDAMSIALHSVYHTDNFTDAVAKCVNMLGDSDSTGSVTGQIAGAFYGYTQIDDRLVKQVNRWDNMEIQLRAILLYGEKVN